jgi:hypothetical protein
MKDLNGVPPITPGQHTPTPAERTNAVTVIVNMLNALASGIRAGATKLDVEGVPGYDKMSRLEQLAADAYGEGFRDGMESAAVSLDQAVQQITDGLAATP